MKHKVKSIHFVGIGGVGMSGIAEVLANLGFSVSGSDQAESATTRRLAAQGIRIEIGHASEHVGEADDHRGGNSVRFGHLKKLE